MTTRQLFKQLEPKNINSYAIIENGEKYFVSSNTALAHYGSKEIKSYKLKPVRTYELEIELEGNNG